jgi:hypothetical protein
MIPLLKNSFRKKTLTLTGPLSFLLVLPFAFSSATSWSRDVQHCDGAEPGAPTLPPGLADAARAAEHREWWAASPAQIQNAPCTREEPLTNDEIDTSLRAWATEGGAQTESRTIHGISFENESSRMLDLFDRLTTRRGFGGRPLAADKQPSFRSNCRKVDCALAEIFGAGRGRRLAYLSARLGMNASHLAIAPDDPPPPQAFSQAHLDEIILAVQDFPPSLLPLRDNVYGDRRDIDLRHTTESGGRGVVANATITLFPPWQNQNRNERRSTLVHELGHSLANFGELAESEEWWRYSGWRPPAGGTRAADWFEARATRRGTCVSEYGCTNPHEDFAESVVAYRYNPAHLRRVSPEKYEFLKNTLFDGLEYTSEEACRARPRENIEARIDRRVAESMSSQAFIDSVKPAASQECGYWIVAGLVHQGDNVVYEPSAYGTSCIERELRNSADSTATASLQESVPGASPAIASAHNDFVRDYSGNHRVSATVPPQTIERVRSDLVRQLRAEIRSGLMAYDRSQESSRRNWRTRFFTSDSGYCQQWVLGIQESLFPLTAFGGTSSPGRPLALTMLRQVRAIAEEVCLPSQAGRFEPQPMNLNRLDQALDRIFGLNSR